MQAQASRDTTHRLAMREQTVGPVAVIDVFDDEDEAPASTLWSPACTPATRAASAAPCFGMAAVNRTRVTGAALLVGRMKQPGRGREGARHGMQASTGIEYPRRDRSREHC